LTPGSTLRVEGIYNTRLHRFISIEAVKAVSKNQSQTRN
jgi:hypothetical protein